MNRNFSDEEIIELIHKGGPGLEKVMTYIYNDSGYSETVRAYIKKQNGQPEDAEDVFQDGISHLILNIRKNRFQGKSQLKTYFVRICKNLWSTRFSRTLHLSTIKTQLPQDTVETASPEQIFLIQEKADLLKDILKELGVGCAEVLELWALSYSFNEIGEKMKKTPNAAKKQKSICKQKLIKLLKNRPDLTKVLLQS